MTLGEQMQALFDATGKQPKAVAIEWHEWWLRTGAKPVAISTVESRMSNLRNDDLDGVRFFFGDTGRARTLFDVLAVAEEERERVRALAEEQLRLGGAPARLVVDLTSLGTTSPHLGKALLALLGDDPPVQPVRLVVTPGQADALPFAFGRREKVFTVEIVEDAATAAARVDSLAEHGALVLSGRPHADTTRWAAVQLKRNELELDPPDALTVYGTTGRLPGGADVTWALQELGMEAQQQPFPDESPIQLRRLILQLASGGPAGVSAGVRLGWGDRLGVAVASRPQERAQAAVVAAGLQVLDVTQQQLRNVLDRAQRRPVGAAALRVDGVVHVVNAALEVTSATDGALVVHRLQTRAPALQRLLDHIRGYTEDDWLEDPALHRAMGEVAAGEVPDLELRHARAWLLRHERPAPAPAQRVCDVERLRTLLAGAFPEPELLVVPRKTDRGPQRFAVGPDVAAWQQDVLAQVWVDRPFLKSGRATVAAVDDGHDILGLLLQEADPRSSAMQEREQRGSLRRRRDRDEEEEPEALPSGLPVGPSDRCLDNYEERAKFWICAPGEMERPGGLHLEVFTRYQARAARAYGASFHDLHADPAVLCAATCRAMRQAMAGGAAEALSDGRVLLDLRNGLSVVVAIREWPAAHARRVALSFVVMNEAAQQPGASATTTNVRTRHDSGGTIVPRGVWLSGAGLAADVTFVATPLLATS